MTALVALQGVLLLLLTALVVGLLRSHAEILRRLHDAGIGILDEGPLAAGQHRHDHDGPPTTGPQDVEIRTRPGVPAPRVRDGGRVAADLVGITPWGADAVVPVSGRESATLVAFLSSGCLTCQGFWDVFREGTAQLPGGDTRLVVVTRGPERESPASISALAPRHLTTVLSEDAWAAYDVPVAPYFVLVDGPSGGVLGEGAAATWDQLVGLLGRAVADTAYAHATQGAPGTGHAHGPGRRSPGERAQDADSALLAAGIVPGDPRLHLPVMAPGE